MRCTACGSVWFQEPEDFPASELKPVLQEVQEAAEDIAPASPPEPESPFQKVLETIPESVRPALGPESLPQARPAPRRAAFASGALAAFLLWISLAGGIFFTQADRLVMAWPPAIFILDFLGVAPHLPGQDMTLEGLKAEISGDGEAGYHLNLSGRVINLKARPVSLVPLRVTAQRPGGELQESWLYKFPESQIKAESDLAFGPSWTLADRNFSAVEICAEPFPADEGEDGAEKAPESGGSF